MRKLVKTAVRRVGYDLRRRGALGRTFGDALLHLRRLGFRPATIVDVGVADGTPDLYSVYPDCRYFLIEPLAEYEPRLRELSRRLNANIVLAAAGPQPGRTTLYVHGPGSSVFHEPDSPFANVPRREVPVITLDTVCAQYGAKAPFLIKVDVQGGELQVLAGAKRILQDTEAVVLETSLFEAAEGWPTLLDVLNWMNAEGFSAYDVCGGNPRPYDGALAQLDIVFVKTYGQFRAHPGYFSVQSGQGSHGPDSVA